MSVATLHHVKFLAVDPDRIRVVSAETGVQVGFVVRTYWTGKPQWYAYCGQGFGDPMLLDIFSGPGAKLAALKAVIRTTGANP